MSPVRDATARRLRAPSSSPFLVALGTVSDVVVQVEADGTVAWASPVVTDVLGHRPEDLVGADPIVIAHPDEVEELRRLRGRVLMGEEIAPLPLRLRAADGSWRQVQLRARPITTGDGVLGAILTIRDEHEAVATRRALATLLAGTRVLVSADDEQTLLRDMCDVAIAEGGYLFSWFGVPSDLPGLPVHVAALAGDDRGYVESLAVSWDAATSNGRGPVGTAVRTRATQVVHDALVDGGFAPWRDLAAERGIRSVIALPVPVGDSLPGTLVVYSDEPRAFGPQAREILESLATDLGYGVHRLRETARRSFAEAQFRLMAENSTDAILLTDEDLVWTWASPSAEAVLGWRPDHLVGNGALDFLHPDDALLVGARFADSGISGQHRVRVRCRQPDGGYRWLLAHGDALRDRDGLVVGRVVSFRDVDDVVRVEDDLLGSESRFRRMAESSVDVLFEVRDDVVAWISPSVRDKLGWSPDELIGHDPEILWDDGDHEIAALERAAIASGSVLRGTFAFRHRDGSRVLLDIRARPFTDPDGSSGITGSARLVPERRGRESLAHGERRRRRVVP